VPVLEQKQSVLLEDIEQCAAPLAPPTPGPASLLPEELEQPGATTRTTTAVDRRRIMEADDTFPEPISKSRH
jgi:hypothetical protein